MTRNSNEEMVHHTNKKRKKRKVNTLNLWTLILSIIVICELIVGITGSVLLMKMMNGKPDLVVDDFFSAESSHIYDKNGDLIADVGTTIRENVTYDELSES